MEEKKTEVLDPQKKQETETLPVKKSVEVLEEELSELKHKAEVSSQNFERAKKAEEELKILKQQIKEVPSEEGSAWSDEGKILENKIKSLEDEIDKIRDENAKKDVLLSHPELKDKWQEFEEFRANPENKGMNLKTSAKAFLVEMGMLEVSRKGLEKTTGGTHIQPKSGMTAEEMAELRKNNFRKYQDMLMKGQLKIEQ